MKKIIKSFLYILLIVLLAGCSLFTAKAKDFSGSGMNITLTEDFVKSDNVLAQLYIVSSSHIFMGNGESKSVFIEYGYDLDLTDYANLVLETGKKDADVENYSDSEIEFKYAYYESTVEGTDYSYMLVCMESQSKFYAMNFGCLSKNFNDKTKDQYFEWAKTIKVN